MNPLSSTTSVLYFAYGANMNETQITTRCRAAKAIGAARLPDHALMFFGHSERWDGGEETVLFQSGEEIYGVVYELTPTAFDRLDAWQGVRLDGTGAYFHCPAEVIGLDGQPYSALMYKRSTLGEASRPSMEYLTHILAGAEAHGLPESYLNRLRAIPSEGARYKVPKADHTDRFLTVLEGSGCSC